jgi:parallel beta-helix repeat protein
MKKILVIIVCIAMALTTFVLFPSQDTVEGTDITVDGGGGGDHLTIQAAVDAAADGDTIIVQPGTYIESVLINKNLKLTAPSGATIKCPASPGQMRIAESSKLFDYLVAMVGGSSNMNVPPTYSGIGTIAVEMSGFVIDADDYVPTQRWASILCRNLKTNSFYGPASIHDNTLIKANVNGHETFGIISYGDIDMTVEGNTIDKFSRGGIGIMAGTTQVLNNIVRGPGLGVPVTWAPNGIQLGYGASGLVQGNEVEGCGWPGTDWSGSGIIIVDTSNVIVDNNYIHDSETAIAVLDFPEVIYGPVWAGVSSDITVMNNMIVDNEWGMEISNEIINVDIHHNDFLNSVNDAIDIYTYEYYYPSYDVPSPSNIIINNNNIIGSGGYGIWMYDAVESNIQHNNIESNELHGIYMEYSHENIIHHNQIIRNKQGMRLDDCDWNEIHHNTMEANRHNGIVIREGSDNNQIHHNIMNDNGWNGIRVRDTGTSDNNIHHNDMINNLEYGIRVYNNARYNTFSHNVAHANGAFDIFATHPAHNTWFMNVGDTSW